MIFPSDIHRQDSCEPSLGRLAGQDKMFAKLLLTLEAAFGLDEVGLLRLR